MEQILEYKKYFTDKLAGYLDLLRKMVEINSFTLNRGGVNQLGNYTANVFSRLGFSAEFVPSTNSAYGDHLLMTKEGEENGKSIALISHLDTVFSTAEEQANYFHWRVEDDRIYGPGTVDIKGGTLMIYMLMDAISQLHPDIFDSNSWHIYLNASEEVLSADFGELCIARLPASTTACLIFEGGTINPGGKYSLVTARKGRATFNVQVEGRSAHAGNNHVKGANAIVQMAHTILKIADMTDYTKQLTFNVGVVQGGSVVNRVPHFAKAEIEMRTFSPDVFNHAVQKMMSLNGTSDIESADGYPCSVSVKTTDCMNPWPQNPRTERLFYLWKEAGERMGITIIPEERGGLSDGNPLYAHFPTIDGLGPAGANAHCSEHSEDGSKEQEFVFIPSFVPKATLNLLAINKLARD